MPGHTDRLKSGSFVSMSKPSAGLCLRAIGKPMNYLVEKMPLLSQAELAQLFGPAPKAPATGVDAGFRYRNAFMLLVVMVHVVRLLFFPDQIYTPFDLSAAAMDQLPQYFQYRGLYVLLVAAVYCYSYTKDWYFDRVALVVFAMASSSLTADFFNIYAFIHSPIPAATLFFILVRVAVIACLLVNAIRANRAPARPCSVFS